MIVSHRATATLEARLRHMNSRDESMTWTLNEIDKIIRQGLSAGQTRIEIQALRDGCTRRLDELGKLSRRELDAIDAKSYPDETDE